MSSTKQYITGFHATIHSTVATDTPNKRRTNMTNDTDSPSRFKRVLYEKIHILQWLPKYNRTWFVSDMIAGITVGLTVMPQSIAYASLVNLPPHYGLYTCIMGCFVYIFFGTIKQVSIGPSSLMSILTYSYLEGHNVDYIILLTFIAGIIELIMGLLNLGFLVDFISTPVTSGFTSSTSVIIVLSQIKNIFGIRFSSAGVFNLITQTCLHLKYAKLSDTILGISSIIALITIQKIGQKKFKNPKYTAACWYVGICRNAVVVLIGSLIAFGFEHNTGRQPFKIAGKITPGLPSFRLPNFSTTNGNQTVGFVEMTATLGSSILVLPLIAVLANVAIAKAFSKGKVIDAGQEMVTLGISNIMGAMVGAMPTTGAFSRSAVNNASNVQTPMGGVYSGAMILLALSFLTPYFYYIPKASIAAVLICAVSALIEYWMVPKLWKFNKFDCFLCLITFVASLFVGVEMGLICGVGFSMMPMLKLWTRPKIVSDVQSNSRGEKYLIVKPELGFFFPSVNYLTETLLKLSITHHKIPIVLNLEYFLQIDYTSGQMLVDTINAFRAEHQKFALVNVKPKVLESLKIVLDLKTVDIYKTMEELEDSFHDEKDTVEDMPLLSVNYVTEPRTLRKTSLVE